MHQGDNETNLCDGAHTSPNPMQKLRNQNHPFWIIDTALEIEKQLPALVVATGNKLILQDQKGPTQY